MAISRFRLVAVALGVAFRAAAAWAGEPVSLDLDVVCRRAAKDQAGRNFRSLTDEAVHEGLLLVALSPGKESIYKVLRDMPPRVESGLGKIAQFDGSSIAVDAEKSQLSRDFDSELIKICGMKVPDPRKRAKALATLQDRFERDVKLAGALAHEAQHKLNKDSGGYKNETNDEESAYSEELSFYIHVPKTTDNIALCAVIGKSTCARIALGAAKDECDELHGFEFNPKERKYDHIYSKRIYVLCDPIRAKNG